MKRVYKKEEEEKVEEESDRWNCGFGKRAVFRLLRQAGVIVGIKDKSKQSRVKLIKCIYAGKVSDWKEHGEDTVLMAVQGKEWICLRWRLGK